MRYPKFLKENGRIGFIAPSFGCANEPYKTCFNEALSLFKKHGYETVLGPNCYLDKGVGKSNSADACGKEIMDFFTDDKCDVIFSCGGGETMCEDLDYVDFENLSKVEPKWYMGYSDNTNLIFPLTTICDTAAIYGPNAPSFGMNPLHPYLKDAFSLIKGEKLSFVNYDKWEKESFKTEDNPRVTLNATEDFNMKAFGKEDNVFSGRLVGGCLDCLDLLCGTKYDNVANFCEKYKEDGIIWFMECCDLSPLDLRRILWKLGSAGWFKRVSGFLFGRSYHYGEDLFGCDFYNAAEEMLGKYDVPILMDLDFGHLPPQIPLISGSFARVAHKDNKFKISMELK